MKHDERVVICDYLGNLVGRQEIVEPNGHVGNAERKELLANFRIFVGESGKIEQTDHCAM